MRSISKVLGLLVAVAALSGHVEAQQLTRAQTARGFMSYGMPAQLANDVAALARQTSGITLDDGSGTSVSILNVSTPTNASATFLAGGADPSNPFGAYLGLAGGGSSLAGVNGTPGGAILSAGVTSGGKATISAPATDGNVDISVAGSIRWTLTQFGDWNQAANGGDLLFNKSSGIRDFTAAVAAAGANQGTAAAMTARDQRVTGSTGANGVILPATPVAGQHAVLWNTVAASAFVLYPGTGDQINNLGVNTGASIAGAAGVYCTAESASQWWCMEAPGA